MTPQYYFREQNHIADSNKTCFALFLDFDGTLSPIRKDPEQCYLSPDIKKLLKAILDSQKSLVAILSGRSLFDLKKRLSLRGIFYAGSHGLEISGPGMRFVHKEAVLLKPVINDIMLNLKKTIGNHKGIIIEEKPYSFALHYRNAAKNVIPFVRESFFATLIKEAGHRQSLNSMEGKKVLELMPRVSWHKGTAALHIMNKLDKQYLPVCVGDDITDETLFETFSKTGITIRVGYSRKSAARYYLKNQSEVSVLLQQIHDRLR